MTRFLPLLALALLATAASAQDIKSTLDELGLEVAMDGGVLEVEPTMGEYVADDFSVDIELELEGGVDYVLFVATDGIDLDPIVFDAEGEGIAEGFEGGHTETLEFSPAETGTYRISLFSVDCEGTCAFGYSVFAR